ncbi:hypothetical protein N7520_011136 [Penicillium odoratum]|uniref:uncharacterized protein n=1 Tax=Penicillium odoratum TaxID=1167516 RepID=UPI0025492BA7|nr:uncharacterized protein N7520_011136 [Penicillium odoratum]KAJ5745954.1 hypothetical protein N7520_011136 [Penicillium odoratum]
MRLNQLSLGFWSASGVPSYTLRVFFSFLLLYTFLLLYVRSHSSRDPGSAFFDSSSAYDLSYSAVRLEQATTYIDAVNNEEVSQIPQPPHRPEFCLGIATIARNGVRYFKSTVGTVVEGLSDVERANIQLILFIAHTDPSQHPAYAEPWLHQVADRVLLYNASEVDVDHIRELESDEAKIAAREKALFDYAYLLKACKQVGAPYTIILEDDVVALDGWYHRTHDAVISADQKTKEMGVSNWLYLRLFYTEEFLGWNSEEWPIYFLYSTLAVCTVACLLVGVRRYQLRFRPHIPNEIIFLLSLVCAPLLIGLNFAAGRVTVLPIPEGVHQMSKFGCCSQAFVFPQSRIDDLVDLYTSKRIGYVDMITEEFANANNEIRWALTPSVIQHVGRTSSKGNQNDLTKSKAEISEVGKLWNFEFELNDADSLRSDHEAANEHE